MKRYILGIGIIFLLFIGIGLQNISAEGLVLTLEVLSDTSAVLHWDAEPGVLYQLWHNGSPLGMPRDSNGAYQMNYSITTPEEYGTYYVTTNTGLTSNSVTFNGGGSGGGSGGTPGTFSVKVEDKYQDGTMEITWDAVSGATIYEIYKDGQKYGELLPPNTILTIDQAGNYMVKAIDGNGNVIAQSNSVYYDGSVGGGSGGDPGTGTGTGCNGCDLIGQMLACPEWGDFMDEWQRMIAGAIPPPPDWNAVSQTFSDAIVPRLVNDLRNMLGYAPDAPTKAQIDSQLPSSQPSLNTSVPDAENLQPQNPFNGVQQFDISNAPEIPIVDESQPFSFTDPVQNINAPEVAKPIRPGDPENSAEMGGVQLGTPGTIETVTPRPTNTPQAEPSDPIPTPSQTADGTMPEPDQQTDGSYPTPTPGEPIIEKRYYKESP